jgi:hypothetical protein
MTLGVAQEATPCRTGCWFPPAASGRLVHVPLSVLGICLFRSISLQLQPIYSAGSSAELSQQYG